MNIAEIGKTIKERRIKMGFNQTQLAIKAGLSLRTISNVELAKHSFHNETLIRILNSLGVSHDDLAQKSDESPVESAVFGFIEKMKRFDGLNTVSVTISGISNGHEYAKTFTR